MPHDKGLYPRYKVKGGGEMSNNIKLCDIKEYEKWLHNVQMSKNTVDVYLREAERLRKYLNGRAAKTSILEQYRDYLLINYKPSSANLYLMACRKYLSFCGAASGSLPKPARVQIGQSVENILSLREYEIMLSFAKAHGRQKDYLIMRTLACTGIRIGELSYITFEALALGKTYVYNKNKYREIYLPNKLVSELMDYCRDISLVSGSVILGSNGTSIDRRSVWEMLQKTAKLCSIDKAKAHPHSFRHLFARLFMEQYSNLPELADILGHSSIETTRRYTMSTSAEKREKMENMPL